MSTGSSSHSVRFRSSTTPPPLFRSPTSSPPQPSFSLSSRNNRHFSVRESSITPPPDLHPLEHENQTPNESDDDFPSPRGLDRVPPSPTDVDISMTSGNPSENDTENGDLLAYHDFDVGHTRDSPIAIESTEEASGDESSSSGSIQSMTAEDRKRYQILSRMMPRVLADRLIKGGSKGRDRAGPRDHRHRDVDSAEHGSPLQPGQSRVRMGYGLDRKIRGDSETSDSDAEQASLSSSSSSIIGNNESIRTRRRSARVITISDSDSDSVDEVHHVVKPRIDDALVDQWVARNHPRSRAVSDDVGGARERDLIDRMLSRTRVPGGKTRPHPKGNQPRRRHQGRRTIRVVTAGAKAATTRQTTLNFRPVADEHQSKAQSSSRGTDPAMAQASNAYQIEADDEPSPAERKRKRDKHRGKGSHGVYTFSTNQVHLASGRMQSGLRTIDQEVPSSARVTISFNEDRAHHALSPQPANKKRVDHTARIPTTLFDHWGDNADSHLFAPRTDRLESDTRLRHTVSLDCGVSLLPLGLTFDSATYIGKGRLRDLVSLLCGEGAPPYPASCDVLDFHLNPTFSSNELQKSIEDICNRLREIINMGTRGSTEELRLWQTVLHSVCQHVSWLCQTLDDPDFGLLSAVVEQHCNQLSTLIEEPLEAILNDAESNILALEIRWFLLELACRIECQRVRRRMHGEISLVRNYMRFLMRRLWSFGLSRPLVFLEQHNTDPDKHIVTDRLTELWVSLIHIASNWTIAGPEDARQPSSTFWTLLEECMQSAGSLRLSSNVEASELIWKCIFSLCALSQFSQHGMTTSVPRLTPGWHFVSFALGRVPLSAELTADKTLKKSALRKRDEYIRMVISRCLLLKQRWRWSLVDASPMISTLLEVFKSRRFANLIDEASDFPRFLRKNNLQLLTEIEQGDTAFTTFLKLVVYAAKDAGREDAARQGQIPPRVKKLLSLAVPVGSIPFTKETPPTAPELSMLYNRFSAVAIAIYLDPTEANLKYRMDHARRYVNFGNTDHDTRQACIRGLMHLTIVLRHLQLPLKHILGWLAEMTNVLVDEYTALRAANDAPSITNTRNWIIIGIQMLLGTVRRIIETPLMDPEQTRAPYPDPLLLEGRKCNLPSVGATRIDSVVFRSLGGEDIQSSGKSYEHCHHCR